MKEGMTIVGLLSRLLGTDPASIHSACIKIYEDARRKRPGKPDRDYLKLVLFTKPPYDYQLDSVIDGVLNECSNIQELADYITLSLDTSLPTKTPLWDFRERNLKMFPKVKVRNQKFFKNFWG